MNREQQQRRQTEAAVRELNAELERRVAERTKALEQQAAVLARQAMLLDLAQDSIVVKDIQSRILFWNRGAEKMFGWSSAEALGRNTYELLDTEFSESIAAIEADFLRQGQWEGEAIQHKRDGTRVIVTSRWTLEYDAEGAPARILSISNDVTSRKQAEEALRESLAGSERARKELAEQQFALDQHADVSVTDPRGTITYANDKFCAISKYSREELVGQNHRILNSGHHSKEFYQQMYQTITRGRVWHGEVRNRAKDGSIYWSDTTIVPFLGEDGGPRQYVAIRVDITDRKAAEEALAQNRSAQLRFKDEFLSHVSHELRTPLTAIKQFTSIMAGGLAGELNKEQLEYLRIVLKNIRQLQSMIDDLLEVTRLETGKLTIEPERVSVADAVTDCSNTLRESARAKGVSLSCEVPSDLPPAHADQTRLRQILIILLDNALKYTPGGGALKIRAALPQDPGFLLVEVSDTGCGMSPQMSGRVFERLYQASGPGQASRKGLGLGLFICKELVMRQGGQISVKSQPNVGSVFSFTLPIFSLSNSLAPLLHNNRWPADSVALIVVKAHFLDAGTSQESQEEGFQQVRSLVERCLMPNLDVLLPKMSYGAAAERFFVAAFADEKGASTLTTRIRKQFERLPQPQRTGRALSVSYTMLKPVPPEFAASAEEMVTGMATNLEQAIKAQITSGAILDE